MGFCSGLSVSCQANSIFGGNRFPRGAGARPNTRRSSRCPTSSPSARVLDCGSGPSSFAAEWGKSGRFVVAVDPIYRFSVSDLESNFERTSARMLAGMRTARDRFRWDHYGSPEEVLRLRRDILNAFLCDFQSVTRRGRYVSGSLPELPFRSKSFDLVLCFPSAVSVLRGIQPRNARFLPPGTASGRARGPGISIVRPGWRTVEASGRYYSGPAKVGRRRTGVRALPVWAR